MSRRRDGRYNNMYTLEINMIRTQRRFPKLVFQQ